MKKVIVVGILLAIGFLAMGQPVPCPCDEGECDAGATAILPERSFTIPLGTIAGTLVTLLCPECTTVVAVAAGVLVPDLKVTLGSDLSGELRVSNCPSPCCEPGRKLYGSVDVLLEGVTESFGIPPTQCSISKFVGATVVDNGEEDRAPAECSIVASYNIPRSEVSVNLVFLGNVVVPIDYSGEVGATITGLAPYASCACGGEPNQPPDLHVLPELVVPLGVETPITVSAEDPDNDPVWIYLSSSDRHPLAGVEIRFNPETRQWSVYAEEKEGLDQATAAVVFYAYDLKPGEVVEGEEPAVGQYYHKVDKSLALKFVVNHPPEAISRTRTIKHADLIEQRGVAVELTADDPDLRHYPDNFGYDYWFAWPSPFFSPAHWDCACPWNSDLSPLFNQCMWNTGKRPTVSFSCGPTSLEWVIYQATEGTIWTGPFKVVEIKPPLEFGFAASGTFTLVVNNKPPELTVSPSEVKVRPGDVVSATVTATDPEEGDVVTLMKVSGPGTFPDKVEGKGSVTGTYTWTVPDPYWGSAWQLVGFRAADGWGGFDLAYLLIHVIQPPTAYDGHVTVPRGGTATASLYLSDPDTPPEGLKVTFTPPPGIEASAVAIEEPPSYYGSYWGEAWYNG